MCHELDHEITNTFLMEWSQSFNKKNQPEDAITVELAFDGLRISYNSHITNNN